MCRTHNGTAQQNHQLPSLSTITNKCWLFSSAIITSLLQDYIIQEDSASMIFFILCGPEGAAFFFLDLDFMWFQLSVLEL